MHIAAALVAQSVKRPELRSLKRGATKPIPGRGIGVEGKILAMPSMGVRGKTHVCRYKCTDWASSKKTGIAS